MRSNNLSEIENVAYGLDMHVHVTMSFGMFSNLFSHLENRLALQWVAILRMTIYCDTC